MINKTYSTICLLTVLSGIAHADSGFLSDYSNLLQSTLGTELIYIAPGSEDRLAQCNVLYLRTALSELYLKKKKRSLMSFTPVGAVVHAAKKSITETLKKIDIIEMTLEVESLDSQTGHVRGAIVLRRGTRKEKGQKEQRMDLAEFRTIVQGYGAIFVCRLDNARTPESQRIDCDDPAVRLTLESPGG